MRSYISFIRLIALLWTLLLLEKTAAQDFLNLNTIVSLQPAAQINTKHLEYAPIYYGPGIVFVHAREQDQLIDLRLGMPFFELMYAELGPDGLPGRASSFSSNIRTKFHEGPCAFTNDLQQVFFTRSNTTNGQNVVGADKRTNLKIYLADKGPEDWENPRELPFCSDDYSVQSPTLSPDNQQIIFMSDQPGGFGGWDLYLSSRSSGTWSEPINLGSTINTSKNERLPYWHEKGVLFFSSEGHGGMGALDIYGALQLEDGSFSAPVNLGNKFNSRQDDLSFICDTEGKTGFFASARKQGLGKDDIYHFTSDQSIFSTKLLEERTLVNMILVVRDENSLVPVPEVSVWIFPIGSMGPEGLEEYFDKQISIAPDSNETVILNLKQGRLNQPAPYLTDIKGAIPVKLNRKADHYIILRSPNYQQREITLPHQSIVNGHEYLIGLERKEPDVTEPVPDKDCITAGAVVLNTSKKSPIQGVLVQVRSTCTGTIQVMETDQEGRFRTCLKPGCDYEVRLLKSGFLEQSYKQIPGTDPQERVVYLAETDLEERTGGIPVVGDILVLEHIYYDFNKSAIRTGDTKELESLAAMMLKYPSMTIELQSHTDARGTEEYNLELSQRRGESVQEFLIARSVTKDRVQLKPMGESRLRNACKDGVQCSDEEHQKNRRTEILILAVDPHLEVKYSDQK